MTSLKMTQGELGRLSGDKPDNIMKPSFTKNHKQLSGFLSTQ
jgi:hypothetical protein